MKDLTKLSFGLANRMTSFASCFEWAIEKGLESCPIGVSTERGTKKPMVARRIALTAIFDDAALLAGCG